jgi:hypothetical protein
MCWGIQGIGLRGFVGAAYAVGMKRVHSNVLVGLTLGAAALVAAADGPKERIESEAEKPSPKLEMLSATTIGGAGVEQVAGAGFGADGGVILFLNSWGPSLPQLADEDHTVVFGRKQSRFDGSQEVYLGREPGLHGAKLNHENTNVSGVVLRCNASMTEVEQVFAFGFGVARFGPAGSCKVAPDGGLIVTGRGQAGFTALAPFEETLTLEESRDWRVAHYEDQSAERERQRAAGRRLPELPTPEERVAQEIIDAEGRVLYLARLSPDATTLEWVFLMDEISRAPNPFVDFRFDQEGRIVFPMLGHWQRLSPDGRLDWESLAAPLPERLDAWSLNPETGDAYLAGRAESDTGWESETFKSPHLSAFDADGDERWRAWGWSGKLAGMERYRLLSPSRVAGIYPRGDSVIAHCVHEGSNSVFMRDPSDLDDALPGTARPLVSSLFAWRGSPLANLLIDLDATTKEVRRWTYWSAFFPDERRPWGHRARRPSTLEIASLGELGDGSLVVSGRCETGLPTTAQAWLTVGARREYESAYVSVLDRDWTHLRYSSYVPAVEAVRLATAGDRMLLFGNAVERDELGAVPIVRPVQGSFGGALDAWFAVAEMSKGTKP